MNTTNSVMRIVQHPNWIALLLAAVISLPASSAAQQQLAAGIKVFVSVDMEGVAGVVTPDQLGPSGFEYERFRRFMTDEALAAVRAAKLAGASVILVADSHGNGQNLLIEDFPRDIRIVRSWPRRGGMIAGLDSSFGAVILIGFHASASSPAGVRAHTYSSGAFTRVALNGRDVGEGELAAAQAGELGVPVIFMSGDDFAIAELRERIPSLVTVETKTALSFHSAATLTPAESAARIETGVRTAFAHLRDMKPYVIAKPVTLEIGYKHYVAAEAMSYLRRVQRLGSRTIRYVAEDVAEAADFISFADSYQAELTP